MITIHKMYGQFQPLHMGKSGTLEHLFLARFDCLDGKVTTAQATSDRVSWEEHGTYTLHLMGHNVIDGKFACPMIEVIHQGTNQSGMHQI